jgi:hypothetical protein
MIGKSGILNGRQTRQMNEAKPELRPAGLLRVNAWLLCDVMLRRNGEKTEEDPLCRRRIHRIAEGIAGRSLNCRLDQ